MFANLSILELESSRVFSVELALSLACFQVVCVVTLFLCIAVFFVLLFIVDTPRVSVSSTAGAEALCCSHCLNGAVFTSCVCNPEFKL